MVHFQYPLLTEIVVFACSVWSAIYRTSVQINLVVQSRTGICKFCHPEVTVHFGLVVLGYCNLKFCLCRSKILTTPPKFITGEVFLVEYCGFILICLGHNDIMTWRYPYDHYASVFVCTMHVAKSDIPTNGYISKPQWTALLYTVLSCFFWFATTKYTPFILWKSSLHHWS